jgi:hypothetical protein
MLAYQYLALNLVKMPFALEDRLAEYVVLATSDRKPPLRIRTNEGYRLHVECKLNTTKARPSHDPSRLLSHPLWQRLCGGVTSEIRIRTLSCLSVPHDAVVGMGCL